MTDKSKISQMLISKLKLQQGKAEQLVSQKQRLAEKYGLLQDNQEKLAEQKMLVKSTNNKIRMSKLDDSSTAKLFKATEYSDNIDASKAEIRALLDKCQDRLREIDAVKIISQASLGQNAGGLNTCDDAQYFFYLRYSYDKIRANNVNINLYDQQKNISGKPGMYDNISIYAGKNAIKLIRDEGLKLSRVKVIAGASGAAKFLVLNAIDRLLVTLLKDRTTPLHLVGTSIGAFRMAAYCHPNPLESLNNLEYSYIHQCYSKNASRAEIRQKTHAMIDGFIQNEHIKTILEHPFMRLNFLSCRCKGLLKSENRLIQGLGLALAAGSNLISRDSLGLHFERALFSSSQEPSHFSTLKQFPKQDHQLTSDNFKAALMSSGSIPLVMSGVSHIDQLPGMYRDGGLLDYHLDLPFLDDKESIVLYPHFNSTVIPGWFDKSLNRKAKQEHLKNVVLITPSEQFINKLPYKKIPDRTDFKTFLGKDKERIKYWSEAAKLNQLMADDLYETLGSSTVCSNIIPL